MLSYFQLAQINVCWPQQIKLHHLPTTWLGRYDVTGCKQTGSWTKRSVPSGIELAIQPKRWRLLSPLGHRRCLVEKTRELYLYTKLECNVRRLELLTSMRREGYGTLSRHTGRGEEIPTCPVLFWKSRLSGNCMTTLTLNTKSTSSSFIYKHKDALSS